MARIIYPYHNLVASPDHNLENFTLTEARTRRIELRHPYRAEPAMAEIAGPLVRRLDGKYYDFRNIYQLFGREQFWSDNGLLLWELIAIQRGFLPFQEEYYLICKVAIKDDQ